MVKLVGESKQAAVVVKGGGVQSCSLVGPFEGKSAVSPRPYNKSLKPTAASSVYVEVVLAMGLTLTEKCDYNGGRLSH